MNRRGFLKFLGMAPAIPAVLKGMDWDRPAEAAPMPVLSKESAAGTGLLPSRADHVHPVVPPGTIMPFNGHSIPDGWLPCDGRLVGVEEYPALYKAIGGSYGHQPTWVEFRVPDMRAGWRTGGNNGVRDHNMVVASVPPSHAHTVVSNGNHTHGALWFQPAYYLIKT